MVLKCVTPMCWRAAEQIELTCTANLRTKILDSTGFDSSIILIIRGGILMSIGDFPESVSRAILIGIMLVGRLAVPSASPSSGSWARRPLARRARPKLAPALAACPLPLALCRKPKQAPAYAYRACCLESTWVALPVSRYLSDAGSFVCFVFFVVSRITMIC